MNIKRLSMVGILIASMQTNCADRRGSIFDDEAARAYIETNRPKTINFELRNKMNSRITVEVQNGPEIKAMALDAGENPMMHMAKKLLTKPQNDSSYTLELAHYKDPITLKITFIDKKGARIDRVYKFNPGKSVFVSFEEGRLKPQKGTNGKTQSGYTIPRNNVTQQDIDKAYQVTADNSDEEDDGYNEK